MRIDLPVWVMNANTSNSAVLASLREREKELTEELTEGGYTKRSYEAADRRELKAIQKLLKSVKN